MKTTKIISIILIIIIAVSSVPVASALNEKSNSDYQYEITGDSITITKYIGKAINLVVPDKIEGYKVTVIGDKAFNDCTKLEKVTLPNSIKKISSSAFFSCTRLTSINLSEGLEFIGSCAFYQDNMLDHIVIPSTVAEIGEYAFGDCSSLSDIILKEGKYSDIPTCCFYNCENIKAIKIPDNVKRVERKAFSRCRKLIDIEFPEKLSYVGPYAFEADADIIRGRMTASVEEIDEYGFYDSRFSDICLEGTESIGFDAFHDCKINKLVIGKSVKELAEGFHYRSRIKEFVVDKNNNMYESEDGNIILKTDSEKKTLFACRTIIDGDYIVKDNVLEIAPYGMAEISSEGKIVIPQSVKKVGKYAFYETTSSLIDFHADVDEIKEGTFCHTALNGDVLSDKIIKIGPYAFTDAEIIQRDTNDNQNEKEFGTFKLPKSVKEIDCSAFCDMKMSDFEVESESLYFASVNGDLYSKDKTEFISVGNSDNTITLENSVKTIKKWACINLQSGTIVLNDGLEIIEDEACINGGENDSNLVIPSSVKKIGKNNFVYNVCVNDTDKYIRRHIEYRTKAGMSIIGTPGSVAEQYAKDNNMGFFTGTPETSFKETTLKSGETAKFSISNISSIKPVYTSTDKDIAKVDKSGNITGVAKGVTYVTAAVNSAYFYCKVTVTSGEYINTDPYKDYKTYTKSSLSGFINENNKFNKFLLSSEDELKNSFPSVYVYTGDDYHAYKAILTGTEDSDEIMSKYGGDIEQFYTYVENIPSELGKFRTFENIVTYSGTSSVSEFTGGDNSLQAMMNSIGKVITEKNITSTAVVHNVAKNFGSGINRTLLQFYVPKDCNVGGYIDKISMNKDEYEYLLPQNIQLKIVDAGVRTLLLPGEDDVITERFMKLKIESKNVGPTEPETEPTSESTSKPTSESTSKPTDNKPSVTSATSSKNNTKVNSSASAVKTGSVFELYILAAFILMLCACVVIYFTKNKKTKK